MTGSPESRPVPVVVADGDRPLDQVRAELSRSSSSVVALHLAGATDRPDVRDAAAAALGRTGRGALRYRGRRDTMYTGVVATRARWLDVLASADPDLGVHDLVEECVRRNGFDPDRRLVGPGRAALTPSAEPARPSPLLRSTYALVGTPRTGSTLLSDLLCRAVGTGLPREHLLPAYARDLYELHDLDGPDAYLDLLHRTESDQAVFGTKVHWHHLWPFDRRLRAGYAFPFPLGDEPRPPTDPDDLTCLQAASTLSTLVPEGRIVRTRRADVVAQAVSAWWAERRGSWFSWSDRPASDREPAVADLTDDDLAGIARRCDDYAGWEHAWDGVVRALGAPVMDVEMDELVRDRPRMWRQVTRFLDLPQAAPPETALRRQSGSARRLLVRDVAAALGR